MKKTSSVLSNPISFEQNFEAFMNKVSDQITKHGPKVGYHAGPDRPNTVFNFIREALHDGAYCHPRGEAIAKLVEFGTVDDLAKRRELLSKAAAWIFLVYDDIQKSVQ